MKKEIENICLWCNKKFYGWRKSQKFCSRSCQIRDRNHNLVWKQSSRDKLHNFFTGYKYSKPRKGHPSWMKGLTKEDDPRIKKMADSKLGDKNYMYGKHPWNYKLTKETDERVRKNAENTGKALKNITYEDRFGKEKAEELKEKARIKSRKHRIDEILKNGGSLSIGKHETQLLNEQELKDNCKIERQYHVIGYITDGYCKETNTIYEVYEHYHNRQNEKDLKRQKDIEDYLGCKFTIILDTNNG